MTRTCQAPNIPVEKAGPLLDKRLLGFYNRPMPTVAEAVLFYRRTCIKCGHSWASQKPTARQCPKCWTRNWDKTKP